MNQIMKFENTTVDVQIINGVPMFELYSVGMALGYVKTNGKSAGVHCVHPNNKSLFPFKSRIDKVAENAEIEPVIHNGQLYITESQIYDFMLEARTAKCKAFRKWLTNEVLPALNHTGSYSCKQLSFQDEPEYEYFDKTFCGIPVLTVKDISHITGMKKQNILWYLSNKCVRGLDYCVLKNEDMDMFKKENPKLSKKIFCLTIVAKLGFLKLCEVMGIKRDVPDCYRIEKKKKPSNDMIDRILNDFGIRKGYFTKENINSLLDADTTATGNSVLRCSSDGKEIFCDSTSDYYERLSVIMKNIGQLILGRFRKSIDDKPVFVEGIDREAEVFSATFLALKLFADYGGFNANKN